MTLRSRSVVALCAGAAAHAALLGCAASIDVFDADIERRSANPEDRLSLIHVPDAPTSASEKRQPLPRITSESPLADCLLHAAMASPELESSFNLWRAALERSPQETSLPDPRLTYGYFISEVETRVGPQRHQIGASQTFPSFGSLELRGKVADREAAAAFQRHQAKTLAIFHRVRSAYFELYHLRRSIEITRENVELLTQFERIARSRYRVAAARHPDVIRAQVELVRLTDRLSQLEDLRPSHRARFNAALGRPADAAAPWPERIETERIDAEFEQLSAWMTETNPDLAALREEIERARARAELARTQRIPDVTLGLVYTVVDEARGDASVSGSGDDAVLATVSVNVPLWRDKYDAGVREALHRRIAAAESSRAAESDLGAALREAMFEHDDAARRISLYENSLIPKARESLQTSLSAFEGGEATFFDLLETERSLLEFQLVLERARADLATSRSRLEMLTGRPLPRAPLAHTTENRSDRSRNNGADS